MAEFLFRAKDAEGNDIVGRVDSDNLETARYKLEVNGLKDIAFQTDAASAAVQDWYKREGIDVPDVSPEAELECLRESPRTLSGMILLNVRATWWIWLPLGAWLGWAIYRERLWHAVLAGVLLVYFLRFMARGILASHLYDRLLSASVLGRWDEILDCVARLEQVNRYLGRVLPGFELDVRRAQALAAQGKLEEALRGLMPYADGKRVSMADYCSRLATVFGYARDFDREIELTQKAIDLGKEDSSHYISLAYLWAHRKQDAARARAALETAAGMEQVEMAASHVSLCRGMIALHEGDHVQAVTHFETALKESAPFAGMAAISGHIREIQSYLGVALGRAGRMAEAGKCAREQRAFLEAQREAWLLDNLRHLRLLG